jgi:hypothetical protein
MASMNWNERGLIIISEAVHGPAVGCIVWLDLRVNFTRICRESLCQHRVALATDNRRNILR